MTLDCYWQLIAGFGGPGPHWLAERLTIVIPLVLSLSVHEWAHAWAAWRLGDDTARLMGRLTLNPLAHIDPVGTLLLPLLGVPFGWAKPVPVNPLRFYPRVKMRTGMMLTAIAGPLSNIVLALAFTILLAVLLRFPWLAAQAGEGGARLLLTFAVLNVILATFNLLPIPPLDGSRVVDGLMPRGLRPAWEGFCQIGPLVLAAVILLPYFSGFSLFAWPMQGLTWLLAKLVEWM
jgi:Zn-dependent protease